jgi:hypothetical protein
MINKPKESDVGKKVKKENGKPFASGNKIAKISAITFNVFSGKPSYKLEGEKAGYVVHCDECEFV